MKIDSQFTNRININNNNINAGNESRMHNAAGSSGIQGPTLNGVSANSRNLAEALSMAQLSRSVVMKAMEIASRLKNMASSAMSGSGVKQAELGQALSDIRTTMEAYSGITSAPSPGISLTSSDADTADNMQTVGSQAYSMMNGEKADIKQLGAALTGLGEKSSEIDEDISRILKAMGIKEEIYGEIEEKTVPEFLSRSVDHILSNPEPAITAQGNINSNIIYSLL